MVELGRRSWSWELARSRTVGEYAVAGRVGQFAIDLTVAWVCVDCMQLVVCGLGVWVAVFVMGALRLVGRMSVLKRKGVADGWSLPEVGLVVVLVRELVEDGEDSGSFRGSTCTCTCMITAL